MGEILDAALKYAEMGLAVIPINPRNKHPFTKNGSHDASTDPVVIKNWWFNHPSANVAIVTGLISNLVVIDQDLDDEKGIDGIHEVKAWEADNGTLPETWTALTGRGGYHCYYRIPDGAEYHNKQGILNGVDIRGEGGYVIAPPSVHANGKTYMWEYSPEDCEIANVDETVKSFLSLKGKEKESSETESERFMAPANIPEGKRNETLFKMAASLWSKNLSEEAILAALEVENNQKCNPPLNAEELKTIVKSVSKYDRTNNNKKESAKGSPNLKRNSEGNILQITNNAVEAIQYDEELYGKIRYNILAYAPFVYGKLPWDKEKTFREWNNTDDANLKNYIENKYGLKQSEKIMDALSIVAKRNAYNPVIEVLELCHTGWDKKTDHIENLLPDYLGCEKSEYNTEALKLFMLGAISRAYHPGCKFDYMFIIHGTQGIGKSTFLRRLALNDAWYNDNFNTVEGDKAPEKLRGMWMVELAELLAAKKAREVESIKAFLTSTEDVYRPPYGRRTEHRPRVCVFAGTTNSDHFLIDRTGNRRYLPIKTNKANVKKSLFNDGCADDFKQAWGEAMELFLKAEKKPHLVLDPKLEETVKDIQLSFTEEDSRVGLIQEWLDTCDKKRVCASMLYQYALGNIEKIPSRRESNEIHDIMQTSIKGWHRIETSSGRARVEGYGVQVCYEKDGSQEDTSELNPFLNSEKIVTDSNR